MVKLELEYKYEKSDFFKNTEFILNRDSDVLFELINQTWDNIDSVSIGDILNLLECAKVLLFSVRSPERRSVDHLLWGAHHV